MLHSLLVFVRFRAACSDACSVGGRVACSVDSHVACSVCSRVACSGGSRAYVTLAVVLRAALTVVLM